jgi:ATP-dependent Clp protease ATP-binding subunit ClpA
LSFEYLPADPSKRAKPKGEDDEEDDTPQAVLVDAAPRKALPSPKEKRERSSKSGGAVPSVPRRKSD